MGASLTHTRSKSILSRLDQEVEIMHCLHHPHIIRVFDVFREDGRITLVLECVQLSFFWPCYHSSSALRARSRCLRIDVCPVAFCAQTIRYAEHGDLTKQMRETKTGFPDALVRLLIRVVPVLRLCVSLVHRVRTNTVSL